MMILVRFGLIGHFSTHFAVPLQPAPSPEDTQEFRVESSAYTAEFGSGTGGQVNVVTKSGSNQFHGALFEYLRNDKLDAANFFDNVIGQKAPLRIGQFGSLVGEQVVKDKAFFFFSYESCRVRAGINAAEAVRAIARGLRSLSTRIFLCRTRPHTWPDSASVFSVSNRNRRRPTR
jgi:hypothetical protein